MRIEQLSSDRILISLEEDDLRGYSLTFEELNLHQEHSRKVLHDLMDIAAERTGVCFRNKKILIEAMQYDRGCLLLLTLSEQVHKRKVYRIKRDHYSIVFFFDNAESLLHCLKILFNMKGKIPQSSVYLYQDRYYLIIQAAFLPKSRYYYTISEFADGSRVGRMLPAFLQEHGKKLCDGNAIKTIGAIL